jgi:L-xylulose reductase
MNIDFTGKRILVTGAGKGIGRVMVKHLHELNGEIIALSRTAADLESLKEEVPCETIVADLGDAAATRKAIEAAGRVDLLVNNAGVAILQPFMEMTVEALDTTYAVNLRAVVVVSQVVAQGMIERGTGGSIVNLSSQASLRALQDHAAYCASKAGLDHLTRVMALELGQHNIRVNCVNPTVVMTPMGKRVWGEPEKSGPMLARIPLDRFAEPIEVSEAVAYLLSDYSAMIHGAVLPIDGGFLVG